MLAGILVPLIFCVLIFGLCYMYWTTRHKERMAMLERGADPSLFRTKMPSTQFLTLKLGLLCMGIALGVLFGTLLHMNMRMEEEPAYFSMIFLFGGLGLVVGYLIQEKKTSKNK